MELHFLPVNDSTWTYTIIYGEDREKGRRPYLLREVDRTSGHYLIDEDNGILLDAWWRGGTLFSSFSVMGSRLQTSLSLRGDELWYDITAGPAEAVRHSGGQKEDIPEVASYRIGTRQLARLRRQ